MPYGLTEKDLALIVDTLKPFTEINEAIIFGSRARNHYQRGSDVDVALKGKALECRVLARIKFALNEEIPLPYYFDVLHFDTLENETLKRQICKEGKSFWRSGDSLKNSI